MRKLTACLAVFCFIGITLADDCRNPLLNFFGFTGLNEPVTVSGLKYCKSLQNGKSCCSSDTVNELQKKAQTILDKLTTVVSQRDKAIVDTRDKVIPGLKSSIEKLTKSVEKAMKKMSELTAGNGNGNANTGTETFAAMATAMAALSTQAENNLPTIKSGFKGFQKSRVSCVVELVNLQASAWCLACDPAYATKGVASNTITLGDNTCNRLQSSCFDFIIGSVTQSAMLSIKAVSSLIDALATILDTVASGDLSAVSSLDTLFSGLSSIDSSVSPVALPNGCISNTQCSWICSNMFTTAGNVDETVIAAGGVASDLSAMFTGGSRLLAEEEEEEVESVVKNKLQKRRLGANEWNPDKDEAGVTITFAQDPAGVGDDKSSGVLKSGLMCLIVMLVALLF